jgi:arsenical pump membrane protein
MTIFYPDQWTLLIWGIAALATLGVIIRPWGTPEAAWAVGGAVLLLVAQLLPFPDFLRGVAKGTDVYLFLIGMMVLAEVARRESLFDWLAAIAAAHARGSATRLFALVYVVGTVVTVFLSNDATAVVLTPAVAAVTRAVRARDPVPFLLICAFVANAASFVLPISNPANLVIYGSHMPHLMQWVSRYGLSSVLAIVATFALLWATQRQALRQEIALPGERPTLRFGGKVAAAGIVVTAIVLMAVSAVGGQLGLPTCVAGLATAGLVLGVSGGRPWPMVKDIAWGVLPLVAGLFVLVEALARTGVISSLGQLLQSMIAESPERAGWASGLAIGVAVNLMNNLPAGLIAGTVLETAQHTPVVTSRILIGVDLGPNLSVTGSLATILWLVAMRREGVRMTSGRFLRIGLVVMPVALVLALAGTLFCHAVTPPGVLSAGFGVADDAVAEETNLARGHPAFSIASSSSMKPAMRLRPLPQKAGSAAFRPNGASSS